MSQELEDSYVNPRFLHLMSLGGLSPVLCKFRGYRYKRSTVLRRFRSFFDDARVNTPYIWISIKIDSFIQLAIQEIVRIQCLFLAQLTY